MFNRDIDTVLCKKFFLTINLNFHNALKMTSFQYFCDIWHDFDRSVDLMLLKMR